MFLTIEDGGDRKTRTYEVVSIKQIHSDGNGQESSNISGDKPQSCSERRSAADTPHHSDPGVVHAYRSPRQLHESQV